ncbi:MAG: MerR family transcriptional regulator [Coriobacteriales bacterium]|nr:MerR family transcriptional regulator [Coriobacteriales bacterium]
MFKIGEFSKLVRVSPRMLRHYEKCGVFHPAEIDKFTGYRLYSAGQMPLLANIVALRDMGFTVDEIADILPHLDDHVYLNRILRAKTAKVISALQAEQAKLDRLVQLSDTVRKERSIMVHEVELCELPAIKVLSLRGVIPSYRDESILWERLGKHIAEQQIPVKSGGYSTYFDEEYKEVDPEVEIAVEVDALGENADEFIYQEYPGIALAATVRFSGPFDGGYDAACEKLASWLEQNGYTFAGLLRGHVIISPSDDENPEGWLTELQVPVEKLL